MKSTQRSIYTVSKQLNRDCKKQALFKERSLIGYLSTPHLKEYLSFEYLLVTVPDKLSHLITGQIPTEN